MVKLLFFCLRVSNSRFEKIISLPVTNLMGELIFSLLSYEREVDE